MFKKRKIGKSSLAQQLSIKEKRLKALDQGTEPLDSLADVPNTNTKSGEPSTESIQKGAGLTDSTLDSPGKKHDEEPVVIKGTNNTPSSKVTFSSAPKRSTVDMTLPNTIYSSMQPDATYLHEEERSGTPVATFSVPATKPKKYGPAKSATSIKATTMIDYAPDVCKDYKQNGYCGFGDTCKFLHIREDYAAGWKLDKEWQEQQQRNRENKGGSDKPGTDDEKTKGETDKQSNAVTTCPICSKTLSSPVITKECGHVFCEKCFLEAFKSSPTCRVCKIPLSGIVNVYKEGIAPVAVKKKESGGWQKADMQKT